MRKSILVALLALLSAFAVVTILSDTAEASTLFVGGAGPGNYTSIQAAIDDANPGDTVYVHNGTYYEALVVDKPLSLVGEARENTTIHTQFPREQTIGTVVRVTSDWVNVSGFTLRQVPRLGWWVGVSLSEVENCTVANNSILDNTLGIDLWKSNSNSVLGNTLQWNYREGILARFSNGNEVSANSVSSSRDGISFLSSNDSTMIQNTVVDSEWHGVLITDSTGNSISTNAIRDSGTGIRLSVSSANSITENHIADNGDGIDVDDSDLNRIYHNNLIGNQYQAFDDNDTNEWDDGYPSGGNYWDDHAGTDTYSGPNQDEPGEDGILDISCDIGGGLTRDRYPLRSLYPLTPPTAPRDLVIFPKNGGALLMWSPPASDGGFPVTNYILYRGTTEGQEVFHSELSNVLAYTDKSGIPGQTYFYNVSAKNALGEGPKSEGVNLTLNPAQPNSLPTCTILYPVPGQEFRTSEVIVITGSSADYDGEVESVEVRIGDGSWFLADRTEFWVYQWNTTGIDGGRFLIHARSYDGMNYSDIASVEVRVGHVHVDGVAGVLGLPVWIWVVAILILLGIAATVSAFLLLKKKSPLKKDDE
jgi:parallel beta-helix repeat protein